MGIQINGQTDTVTAIDSSLNVGGDVTIPGVLTYDDVTNIDSIGIITARSGIDIGVSGGGDNTFIDNIENGHLNIINSGRQANNGRVRINKTNSASGDTTYFRDFEVYDGKDNLLLLADGSSGNIGIGTDAPTQLITVGAAVTTSEFQVSPHSAGWDIGVTSGDISPHYQGNFRLYTGQIGSGTERFRINKEGIITKPYQVAFFAYCSIDDHDLTGGAKFQFNTIPSAGGNKYVAVNTNHTTYNGTNVFDTTNNRFTAPVAGLYHFTVAAYFRRTGDPLTAIVPYVNNAQVVNGNNDVFFFSNQDINDGQTLCGSVTLQLAANDYVSVHRRGGQSGTTRLYGPHSHFCGHLIG